MVGKSENDIIHLINSGASCLDGSGASLNENGEGCMKQWWNMTERLILKPVQKQLIGAELNYEYFRIGGFSSRFDTQAEMPMTMIRTNIVEGVGRHYK